MKEGVSILELLNLSIPKAKKVRRFFSECSKNTGIYIRNYLFRAIWVDASDSFGDEFMHLIHREREQEKKNAGNWMQIGQKKNL